MLVNNRRLIIIATGLFLLMIPLVAMQFSKEVNWTIGDFIVMGGLLFGTGMVYEFLLRKVRATGLRIILFAMVAATFLIIWADLAVGIFGTPFSGS